MLGSNAGRSSAQAPLQCWMHCWTHVTQRGEAVLGSNAGGSNAQVSLQCWMHRRTHVTRRGEAMLGSNAGRSSAQALLQCWMHCWTHVTQRGEAVLGSNAGGSNVQVSLQCWMHRRAPALGCGGVALNNGGLRVARVDDGAAEIALHHPSQKSSDDVGAVPGRVRRWSRPGWEPGSVWKYTGAHAALVMLPLAAKGRSGQLPPSGK